MGLTRLRKLGHDADLVTLQECSRPDSNGAKIIWQATDPNQCVDVVSTQSSLQIGPRGKLRRVIWKGIEANRYGGVAVVSTPPNRRIEFVKIPFLHRNVVPVVVHAREPFLFVGVWTQEEPSYARVAWEAMYACAHAAEERGLPPVAAGDFNISREFEGKKGADASKVLKCMQNGLGLVSAYHNYPKRKALKKIHATHYFRFKKANPFHIDYCFVSKE